MALKAHGSTEIALSTVGRPFALARRPRPDVRPFATRHESDTIIVSARSTPPTVFGCAFEPDLLAKNAHRPPKLELDYNVLLAQPHPTRPGAASRQVCRASSMGHG